MLHDAETWTSDRHQLNKLLTTEKALLAEGSKGIGHQGRRKLATPKLENLFTSNSILLK